MPPVQVQPKVLDDVKPHVRVEVEEDRPVVQKPVVKPEVEATKNESQTSSWTARVATYFENLLTPFAEQIAAQVVQALEYPREMDPYIGMANMIERNLYREKL